MTKVNPMLSFDFWSSVCSLQNDSIETIVNICPRQVICNVIFQLKFVFSKWNQTVIRSFLDRIVFVESFGKSIAFQSNFSQYIHRSISWGYAISSNRSGSFWSKLLVLHGESISVVWRGDFAAMIGRRRTDLWDYFVKMLISIGHGSILSSELTADGIERMNPFSLVEIGRNWKRSLDY